MPTGYAAGRRRSTARLRASSSSKPSTERAVSGCVLPAPPMPDLKCVEEVVRRGMWWWWWWWWRGGYGDSVVVVVVARRGDEGVVVVG